MNKTSLTNYPINPDINYWEANPQVKYIEPFNLLYEMDDGGENSSKYMYCITFFCDPDEQENKYFRMSEEVRKKNLQNYFKEVDWDHPLFIKGLEAYPFECMDSIKRALKQELESAKKRAKLISAEPTLDGYMLDEDGDYIYDKSGKPIWIKGTAKQLDDMRKSTAKIYEDIDRTIERYMSKKADEIRIRGGRKQTLSERDMI